MKIEIEKIKREGKTTGVKANIDLKLDWSALVLKGVKKGVSTVKSVPLLLPTVTKKIGSGKK